MANHQTQTAEQQHSQSNGYRQAQVIQYHGRQNHYGYVQWRPGQLYAVQQRGDGEEDHRNTNPVDYFIGVVLMTFTILTQPRMDIFHDIMG